MAGDREVVMVVSYSGNVTKTTLTNQMIAPYIDALVVRFDTVNDRNLREADVEASVRQFRKHAEEVMDCDDNVVIDVGGSNIEAVFTELRGYRFFTKFVTKFVIPTPGSSKEMGDTVETVAHLLQKINVPAEKIVVVASKVDDEASARDFDTLKQILAEMGVKMVFGVFKNDLLDRTDIRGGDPLVYDLAELSQDDIFAKAQEIRKTDPEAARRLRGTGMDVGLAASAAANFRDIMAKLGFSPVAA